MRSFFLPPVVLLTLAFALFAAYRFHREAQEVRALEHLRRLVALTLRDYPEGNPPSGIRNLEFWRRLGRAAPIADPWGNAFLLVRRGEKGEARAAFFWCSAGPDGLWQTKDDLELEVPFAAPIPPAANPG